MLALKPFIRITILSSILAILLIYLGIKYHWGDLLKPQADSAFAELEIPNTATDYPSQNPTLIVVPEDNSIDLKIIESKSSSTEIASMNKEQITEQCLNLLSKEIQDTLTLELATVNCVVSNYQETYQNIVTLEPVAEQALKQKKGLFSRQCATNYTSNNQYSPLEKQLLIGICVSDMLNINQ